MLNALILAASVAFSASDAQFAYSCASNFVNECTPRDAGTVRGKIASNWILDKVSSEGVDIRRDVFKADTPNGERTFTNLYCEFRKDQSADWVVVMSHFDTKPGSDSPGANDGASTTGLLMALARSVAERGLPKGNLMLIWTDGEECMHGYAADDGFWGSRRAVDEIVRRELRIRAAICIDMLGDRDLKVTVPANCDDTLAKISVHAARRAGLGEGFVTRIAEDVKDDHLAFASKGWRAIDFIDFDYGSAPGLNDWWHTPADTVDKISVESLHKSGRLVAEMLNILL